MIRYTLVLLLTFLVNSAFGDEMEKDSTPVPQASADVDANEAIVHQHDLSTHMGWGEQQAVFKSPRNFRSKHLDEISPDSLEEIQEGSNN